MAETNQLLREILQEIREVKTHFVPNRFSAEQRKAASEQRKVESEERKASRSPAEQAKIDARVAAMQAGRSKKLSAGGGSEISGLSFKNILSKVANASKSEREHISSLLSSSKKAPNKVVAHDLYYNPAMDCFVDKEGNCFYSNLNETTLDPIPNMSRMIGKLRPGVDREKAQPSNFVESNARSRKRKNRRNRTRKN